MIRSFRDRASEDIFNGVSSRQARQRLPTNLRNIAGRKLDQLNAALNLEDLRIPPANRLETLRGDRRGQHSIRINSQYRIYFLWRDAGADSVEIVDYH